MKKFLVIFLIFLVGLIDTFRPVYFSIWQQNWRKQIRRELKSEILKHHLVNLTFSKKDLQKNKAILKFISQDEFYYNGNIYDIVKFVQSSDSVAFVCYLDITEMMQISALIGRVAKSGNFLPALLNLKSILLLCNFYILFSSNVPLYLFRKLQVSYFFLNTTLNMVKDVPEPPPKIYIW